MRISRKLSLHDFSMYGYTVRVKHSGLADGPSGLEGGYSYAASVLTMSLVPSASSAACSFRAFVL